MLAALVMLFAYGTAVWLVFFRFRWLKFTIAWGVVSVFFGLHLLLIFMIGLRFVADVHRALSSTPGPLVPRPPEPTLVTAVLSGTERSDPRGPALFQFGSPPYEYKVRELGAGLAAAHGTCS